MDSGKLIAHLKAENVKMRLRMANLVRDMGQFRITIGRLRAQKKADDELIRKLSANSAFYKCCALSGELPLDGSEPFPEEQEKDNE